MVEKFYLEEPNIHRKEDAISYIHEFYEYNSAINGAGGLHKYLDDYNGWLKKLEEDYTRIPNEEKVPSRTYFLSRDSEDRIVGMIILRLALKETLRKYGGHIGYSIRPTERGKGYNKINLYLGLKVCQAHGIKTVLMDADKDNPASWRTMEALGGIQIREFFDDENAHGIVKAYEINVGESLRNNAAIYGSKIGHNRSRKESN